MGFEYRISDSETDDTLGRIQAGFAEFSRLTQKKTAQSAIAFLVSLEVVFLFADGMPLHQWLSPWGYLLGGVSLFTLVRSLFWTSLRFIGDEKRR